MPEGLNKPSGEPTTTTESLLSAPNLRRTGSSIRWKLMGSFVERITSIVALAVLARLLDVSDFGLVHLAIAALSLLGMLRDVGVPQTIIQRKEASDEFINTCFCVRMVVGLGLYALIVLISRPIALLYEEPELTWMLLVMGTTYFLDAIPTVQDAVLIRELRIREATLGRIGGMILGLATAIAMANMNFGAWALAANGVVSTVATGIFLAPLCPWRPSLKFNGTEFRHLLGFGGPLTGTQLLSWCTENFSVAVLGYATPGTAEVGVFRQAYIIGKWPDSLIGSVLGGGLVVSFFSRVQGDIQRMKHALVEATGVLYLVSLPIAVAIFIFSHDVIMVVYGKKWVEVVPLCRVLVIGGTFLMLRLTLRHWLVAIGRPRVLLMNQAFSAAFAVVLTLVGLYFGIRGVTVGTTLACVLESILLWHMCREFTEIGPIEWFRHFGRPVLVAFVVGLAMFTFTRFALHWQTAPLHLGVGLVVGGLTWLPMALWLTPRHAHLILKLTLQSIPILRHRFT